MLHKNFSRKQNEKGDEKLPYNPIESAVCRVSPNCAVHNSFFDVFPIKRLWDDLISPVSREFPLPRSSEFPVLRIPARSFPVQDRRDVNILNKYIPRKEITKTIS